MRAAEVLLPSDLSTEIIDRKAKARVIYNRVRDHPSPPMCMDTVMSQLQEYAETSRLEAKEVMQYLSDLVKAAIRRDPLTEHEERVDWHAFADKLCALCHAIEGK
ncbi:hypothetical protein BGX28_006522 [Mortierella sp. GBA30]|nr:hypothetical protein BGX28_006522 [Mortierella sp. GBA30]